MTSEFAGGLLTGLTAGQAQTWGAARLVPLLRATPVPDLRLSPMDTREVVDRCDAAYLPHAFVASRTADGVPVAAYGTQLWESTARPLPVGIELHYRRRAGRRDDRLRRRFLPLPFALEGLLGLQFDGPPGAWQEWVRRAAAQGQAPRVEAAYAGTAIPGLDDALRVFEIHPGQCGLALYLADALATVCVVPHPDDYRVLHPTLLEDLYGELLYQYTQLFPAVPDFHQRLDGARIDSVADLRRALGESRDAWRTFHAEVLLPSLGGAATEVRRLGSFTLWRLLPAFDPGVENHAGEYITDGDGRLAYLKTFRLSAAQTRRGYLLSRLAANGWSLAATAEALGTDRAGLRLRLERAGFGHFVHTGVVA